MNTLALVPELSAAMAEYVALKAEAAKMEKRLSVLKDQIVSSELEAKEVAGFKLSVFPRKNESLSLKTIREVLPSEIYADFLAEHVKESISIVLTLSKKEK